MKLLSIFLKVIADNRGATAVEYGLILALVFIAMLGAVQGFGDQLRSMFNDVSTTSVNAMQQGG
jgi:pilus assembly protein Flp/PilA